MDERFGHSPGRSGRHRRRLPRRDDGRRQSDDQPLQPVPVGPVVDLDAQLFRILDDVRLYDLSAHRQARTPGRRRPGTV